jgi:hypothetical protein
LCEKAVIDPRAAEILVRWLQRPRRELRRGPKESGEVADVKTARLVYTVRDGKIVHYEIENLDESEVTGAPAH